MTSTEAPPDETVIHILWINAGLSCDGDSVALTAATQPSIEEIALGALPGLPKIAVHWPLIDFECGPVGGADDFIEWFFKADRGELEPFVLVVEGSIPNEKIKSEGYWCGFGNNPDTDQPMTTSEWLDRLAPKALALVAVGTCATYGGMHAMAGNPTGAMGVPDYLGWDWKSKAGLPIVCVPGCPAHPDNMSETLLYLLYQATGQAPMIPLDEALRPTWLFGATVHEGCDRAGYYEQGDFATEYGSPKCIVKLGCWGPVVKCNVPMSSSPPRLQSVWIWFIELDYARESSFREFRLDRRDQRGIVRRNAWREPSDHSSVATDQELLEIPKHLRRRIRLDAVSLELPAELVSSAGRDGRELREFAIQRVLLFADDRDLGEQRECHVIGRAAEACDVGLGARLLAGKVVRREPEHDETQRRATAVELLEPGVLRREAALRRDVDDEGDLAAVGRKRGRLAVDRLDGNAGE